MHNVLFYDVQYIYAANTNSMLKGKSHEIFLPLSFFIKDFSRASVCHQTQFTDNFEIADIYEFKVDWATSVALLSSKQFP